MNALLKSFQSILHQDHILVGDALADRYHHIWSMDQSLNVKALLLPNSTEQVASIMKVCHAHNQPVIVSSDNDIQIDTIV